MDKEIFEIFCKIAKKIVIARGAISEIEMNQEDHNKIRNLLDDCIEIMAIKADVAPIKLISN